MKAIIIGAGPSLKQKEHLKILSKSKFEGMIFVSDFALPYALEQGITPDKFPNYHVFTTEDDLSSFDIYNRPEVIKHGKKIKFYFVTVHERLEELMKSNNFDVKLFQDDNYTSILGNVGAISWYFAWHHLGCDEVALIGFDMAIQIDESLITPEHQSLFLTKGYNPELKLKYTQDPIYFYRCESFKEIASMNLDKVKTVNCTEGGALFGQGIVSMEFKKWLGQ